MKCLKCKASHDIAQFLSKIYHQLQTQHNIAIKVVRTDNGSELKGFLEKFLFDKGIVHQVGDDYKHHQPGCAARSHRSILEHARTILLGYLNYRINSIQLLLNNPFMF